MRRVLFAIGYVWALPTTLIGLVLAFGGLAIPYAFRRGALIFRAGDVGPWRWWANAGWAGITFGGVIIVRDWWFFSHDGPLMDHELRHFAQARLFGPLFLPLYGLGALYAWLKGGDIHDDNPFEQDATRAEVTNGG